MRGKAKVIITGNVGQNPETRHTPSGAAVTTVSIAVNEEWKDKNTGEKKQSTDWHKVVFFGKLAEIVAEHVQPAIPLCNG
jgi:single-strand DNA-binding protein